MDLPAGMGEDEAMEGAGVPDLQGSVHVEEIWEPMLMYQTPPHSDAPE